LLEEEVRERITQEVVEPEVIVQHLVFLFLKQGLP
jgi:hypothetical protein